MTVLTGKQASDALKKYGYNELISAPKNAPLRFSQNNLKTFLLLY